MTNIQNENYNMVLDKAKNVITSWMNQISLTGKVIILNSLEATLFVYKMMVLGNLNSRQIENFEEMVRDF